MSTIRVDNIQASDGLTPALALTGIACTLLVYDQITPSVLYDINVTSVTDNTTGEFTVDFTDAFANADEYTVEATASRGAANGDGRMVMADNDVTTGVQTGSVRMVCENDAGAQTDCARYSLAFHGDLA